MPPPTMQLPHIIDIPLRPEKPVAPPETPPPFDLLPQLPSSLIDSPLPQRLEDADRPGIHDRVAQHLPPAPPGKGRSV